MSAPYDYILFCALSTLFFAGLQAASWRVGASKRLRVLSALAIALVLVAGWPLTEWWGESTRQGMVNMLTGYAPTYASDLEAMGHASVGPGTPADDPTYLRMIEAQKRWLTANPSANDIYTFRRDADGTVRLIVDSETDYDRSGRYMGEREQRTTIGEPYDATELPDLHAAFEGHTTFDGKPYTDRWGTWVSAYAPIRSADGHIDGVLGVDFDARRWSGAIMSARFTAMGYLFGLIFIISVGAHLLATLDRHRQQALAGIKAKGEFLATMSHELRTPMNGVSGIAGVLLDTPLDDDQREYVRTIRDSSDSLLALLNDIMDFSKAEAGRMELERVAFNVEQVLADIIKLLTPRAREKWLKLELVYDPEAPRHVIGDPFRLRQVLVNLVGNAIKFTEEGIVRIVVRAHGGTATQACLQIAVEDTGIGIAREAQALVFERFQQADGSTTRRFGGTGLGLAISQQLVKLMGSTIQLESEPGRGSRFWFFLVVPITEAPPEKKPSAKKPGSIEPLAEPRFVLLVEDNIVNQRVAEHLLKKLGCTLEVAHDGREALELLAMKRFDVVLMDCLMPELDGFETTREWRRREPLGRHVPIIAMTANAMSGDRERCLEAGMDDYLTKPIQSALLADALTRWGARRAA